MPIKIMSIIIWAFIGIVILLCQINKVKMDYKTYWITYFWFMLLNLLVA